MSVWEGKIEDDILDCIEEACRNSYEIVENFHKKDRLHENSVDISCERSGEKTNFQAKVKPGKKDIAQLVKFSKSVATKRIYIYVDQPSRPFKERMLRLKKLVDFWDAEQLHKFLLENRSQLYIRFSFLGCKMAQDIYSVLLKIFSQSKLNPTPLDSSMVNDWWEFKDRAVKLHSSLEHEDLYWKDKLLSQADHDPVTLERLLGEVFLSFSIIGKTCSEDLLSHINTIIGREPSVMSYYVIKVLKSSSWMGMGRLKDELGDPSKAGDTIHNWMLPTKASGSEYSLISNYLGDLHRGAEAIEDGVDFVFEDFENKMSC